MKTLDLIAEIYRAAAIAEELAQLEIEIDEDTEQQLLVAFDTLAYRKSGLKGRASTTCPRCKGSGYVLKSSVTP